MAGSYIADRPEKVALVEGDAILVGDSAVVGAGSGKKHLPKQSATASSVPLRTAGGQLKAADAAEDSDLVTMKQLKLVKTLALAGVVLP